MVVCAQSLCQLVLWVLQRDVKWQEPLLLVSPRSKLFEVLEAVVPVITVSRAAKIVA